MKGDGTYKTNALVNANSLTNALIIYYIKSGVGKDTLNLLKFEYRNDRNKCEEHEILCSAFTGYSR